MSRFKLLLIAPPIQDFYDTEIRHFPLGLLYLKKTLNNFFSSEDLEVVIRDYHHGYGKRTVAIPKELKFLKKYWQCLDSSPFCGFASEYYHFGASYQKIEEDIQEIMPDVIGISSNFTPYFQEVLEVAKIAKKINSRIKIIIGGHHATAMAREILISDKNRLIDYVIVKEGERPLVEFFYYLFGIIHLKGVSNLVYRTEEIKFKEIGFNEIVYNEITENYNINELPIPTVQNFCYEKYCFKKKMIAFVITSRSCPCNCSFCSVRSLFGSTYRLRNVDSVLDEISWLYTRGVRIFDFEDDNLTCNKKFAKTLFEKIFCWMSQNNIDDIEFYAMNGISYLGLDKELLLLMKKINFQDLNLSLVTVDQTQYQKHDRPFDLALYTSVVFSANALKFPVVSYNILGLPGDSIESMLATIKFNTRLPVLIGASPFYLVPNSPIYFSNNCVELFTSNKWRLSRLTALGASWPSLNNKLIYTLFMLVRIINFLKSFDYKALNVSCLNELLRVDNNVLTKRDSVGIMQLRTLFKEKKLFSVGTESVILNIDVCTIMTFFQQVEKITNRNGDSINVY